MTEFLIMNASDIFATTSPLQPCIAYHRRPSPSFDCANSPGRHVTLVLSTSPERVRGVCLKRFVEEPYHMMIFGIPKKAVPSLGITRKKRIISDSSRVSSTPCVDQSAEKLLHKVDDFSLVHASTQGNHFSVQKSFVHSPSIASQVGCVATVELLLAQRYELSNSEGLYVLESAPCFRR